MNLFMQKVKRLSKAPIETSAASRVRLRLAQPEAPGTTCHMAGKDIVQFVLNNPFNANRVGLGYLHGKTKMENISFMEDSIRGLLL